MTTARKPTGMRASRRAASRSERSTVASSTAGSVFGIATTATKPPAAAARVPESRSSLCSCPGTRRCTCGSTKPGNRWRPSPSSTSAPSGASSAPGAPSSAIAPSRTSTSCGASIPARGSSTWAPRIEQVGGRLLAVHERLGAARAASARRSCRHQSARGRARCARRAARRAPPSARRRRPRPAGRSPPAASRSPRRRARRRG